MKYIKKIKTHNAIMTYSIYIFKIFLKRGLFNDLEKKGCRSCSALSWRPPQSMSARAKVLRQKSVCSIQETSMSVEC